MIEMNNINAESKEVRQEDFYSKLRTECWNNSYDCSAMRYIFEKRGERLRFKINFIKSLGILVPASVGATALSYGVDSNILKIFIVMATALMLVQFVVSVFAIVYKWDEELAYSYEAIQAYNPLYIKYRNLANLPPSSYEQLRKGYDDVNVESAFRDQQNAQHRVKEWEERMGMRYSLREHQCKCLGCKLIPLSMESTNCDVCGKFSFKYQSIIHKFKK